MNERVTQVMEQFARFAGLSDQEAAQWEGLCENALLSLPLREGADETDPRLTLAAAGEAYRRWKLLDQQAGVSLQVGEVSLSQEGDTARAQALRDALMTAAAPLLEGGGLPAGIWQVG